MARKKTIKISGLNIVSQPHSPQQYVEIFERLKKTQQSFSSLQLQRAFPNQRNSHITFSKLFPHFIIFFAFTIIKG